MAGKRFIMVTWRCALLTSLFALTLGQVKVSEERGLRSVRSIGSSEEENGDDSALIEDNVIEKYNDCYEDDRKRIPIVYRKEWHMEKRPSIWITNPVQLLVIRDGGERCYTKEDCLAAVRSELTSALGERCDHQDNFIIGGDGNVYEARGWNIAPYWYLNGLRNASISVKFQGSYKTDLPPASSLVAFQAMVVMGVWSKKISPSYRIISMRRMTRNNKLMGDKLYQNLVSWKSWVNESYPESLWEYNGPESLKCALRNNWEATEATIKFDPTDPPVRYVLVSSGGERCYTRDDCAKLVKSEQDSTIHRYGDLLENFHVGDDGNVYEGRGWDVVPHWYIRGLERDYVSVRFLGNHQSDLPSKSAIDSFKSLINTGMELGKISRNFDLISLGMVYNNSNLLGKELTDFIKRWTPWSKRLDSMPTEDLFSLGMPPVIKRNEWKAQTANKPSDPNTRPINYILILDGEESCFTMNECLHLMREEQTTFIHNYGDLLDNFYVGCDGIVYEGRGWDSLPQNQLKYFNTSCITVKFLCADQATLYPHLDSIAFNSLVKYGITKELLSPSYRMYSLRHVYDEPSFLRDQIVKEMEAKDNWMKDISSMSESEKASKGLLPILFREDWDAIHTVTAFQSLNYSAEFVVIRGVGDRCFTTQRCTTQMREEQARDIGLYGDILDHFYVGDDGNAYEGRKFTSDPDYAGQSSKRSPLFVSFFGGYEDEPPSMLALAAFHRLIKFCVNNGILASTHRVLSNRQILNNSNVFSDELYNEVSTWETWTDAINDTDVARISGRYIMVPKQITSKMDRNKPEDAPPGPADYVIILDGGSRCSGREGCLSQVRGGGEVFQYGGGSDNFLVGEDHAYEGLGWNGRSLHIISCPKCSYIVVRFLGKYMYELPSPKAMDAFHTLLKWGVALGKLSPNYEILSSRQLCEKAGLIGDALNLSVRKWDRWSEKTNMTTSCEVLDYRLVTVGEWAGHRSIGGGTAYKPIRYIYVRDRGEQCFTSSQCTELMKKEHDEVQRYSGGVIENFYVGEDGNVYEGRGWDKRPGVEFQSQSINVLFFGVFDNKLPAPIAISAFKNFILRSGLDQGKLSENYEILPINHGYSKNIGYNFQQNLSILKRL